MYNRSPRLVSRFPPPLIIFLIFGGLGLLTALGVFWLLRDDAPLASSYAAPLIKPDYNVFKIKALQPGGTPILHQDKEIYNQFLKNKQENDPEKDLSPLPDASFALLDESTQSSFPPSLKSAPSPTPPTLESLSQEHVLEDTSPKALSDIFENLLNKGLEDLENTKTFYVALPPLLSKDLAQIEWRRLRTKNKNLLQNIPMAISRLEKSSGEAQFQVQIGNFTSSREAENLCLSLQHKKISCIVAEKKGE